MKVKPNPNKTIEGETLKVFNPVTKTFLPTEGLSVPNNEYWLRRLRDGDVVKVTEEAAGDNNVD